MPAPNMEMASEKARERASRGAMRAPEATGAAYVLVMIFGVINGFYNLGNHDGEDYDYMGYFQKDVDGNQF